MDEQLRLNSYLALLMRNSSSVTLIVIVLASLALSLELFQCVIMVGFHDLLRGLICGFIMPMVKEILVCVCVLILGIRQR